MIKILPDGQYKMENTGACAAASGFGWKVPVWREKIQAVLSPFLLFLGLCFWIWSLGHRKYDLLDILAF